MRWRLVLSEVGQGLRRNLSMVISVVLVTFVSLSFVGVALLMQFQIGEMRSYWNDRAQVVVYLCNGIVQSEECAEGAVTDTQRQAVEDLLASPGIGGFIELVEFDDQDKAYQRYLEQFPERSDWVTPELLQETFWVTLKNPDDAPVILEALSGYSGVESVIDQREFLEGVFAILNGASVTAIGIAVLMLIAAALLISTTIRLSAYSRRRELSIMRLVGASNGFIQTPFILEGAVAALIGALLAGGATAAIAHFFVQGYLQSALPVTSMVGLAEALLIAPILIVLGVIIAALAAGIAINRYLRV